MKKHILIGLAALALVASCSKDNDYHAVAESTINVLSAQTSLGPNDSEGAVKVDCTPVQAYTDEPEWLSATVDGNTVKLAAIANDSRQSRNAKLVIKKAANDSIVLNVSQLGLVLTVDNSDFVLSTDRAGATLKECSCNTAVEITYAPEWATVTVDAAQGTMDVELSANTSGHFRADYIKYRAAGVRDSFIVKQYDFDKDIAGEYVLAYNTFTEDRQVELRTVHATLSRDGLSISVPDYGDYTFPVIVNDSIGAVQIRSNQNIGRFGKYYVYNAFIDTNGGYYYGTQSGLITAPFKYSEEYGHYGFFSGVAYDLYGESGTFLSMILQVYKTNSPSKSNYMTDLFWMASPYLLQRPKDEAAAQTLGARQHADSSGMKRFFVTKGME